MSVADVGTWGVDTVEAQDTGGIRGAASAKQKQIMYCCSSEGNSLNTV